MMQRMLVPRNSATLLARRGQSGPEYTACSNPRPDRRGGPSGGGVPTKCSGGRRQMPRVRLGLCCTLLLTAAGWASAAVGPGALDSGPSGDLTIDFRVRHQGFPDQPPPVPYAPQPRDLLLVKIDFSRIPSFIGGLDLYFGLVLPSGSLILLDRCGVVGSMFRPTSGALFKDILTLSYTGLAALPPGPYTFLALGVRFGGNPADPRDRLTGTAQAQLILGRPTTGANAPSPPPVASAATPVPPAALGRPLDAGRLTALSPLGPFSSTRAAQEVPRPVRALSGPVPPNVGHVTTTALKRALCPPESLSCLPPSVPVPPNISHVTGTVLKWAVWPPGSLSCTTPSAPPDPTFYSLVLAIQTSSDPVIAGLGSLTYPGATIEAFSSDVLAPDLVGKAVAATVMLTGAYGEGVRWVMSDVRALP